MVSNDLNFPNEKNHGRVRKTTAGSEGQAAGDQLDYGTDRIGFTGQQCLLNQTGGRDTKIVISKQIPSSPCKIQQLNSWSLLRSQSIKIHFHVSTAQYLTDHSDQDAPFCIDQACILQIKEPWSGLK